MPRPGESDGHPAGVTCIGDGYEVATKAEIAAFAPMLSGQRQIAAAYRAIT